MSDKSSSQSNDRLIGKHPTDEELFDYFIGDEDLTQFRKQELSAHLLVCQQCTRQGRELQQTETELEHLNKLPLTAVEQSDLARSLAIIRSFYRPAIPVIQGQNRSVFSNFKAKLVPLTAAGFAIVVVFAISIFVYRSWQIDPVLPQGSAKVELPEPKVGPSVEPSPTKQKEKEKKSDTLSKKQVRTKDDLPKPNSQTAPIVQLDVEEAGERGGQVSRRQPRVLKVPKSGLVNLRIRLSEESPPGPYLVRVENAYFEALGDGVKCESFNGKQLNVSLDLKQFQSGVYYVGVLSRTGATQHVEVRLERFK